VHFFTFSLSLKRREEKDEGGWKSFTIHRVSLCLILLFILFCYLSPSFLSSSSFNSTLFLPLFGEGKENFLKNVILSAISKRILLKNRVSNYTLQKKEILKITVKKYLKINGPEIFEN